MRSLAACRFWLINRKMDRKMASSETAMVNNPNGNGSNATTPGTRFRLVVIQKRKNKEFRVRNAMLPLNAAIQSAARHTGKFVQILEAGGQSPDHPVHPSSPETRYLKAFFCRVTRE